MELTIRYTAAFMSAMASPSVAALPASIVGDWFKDLANSMSESFSNTRVDIVKQLASVSLPTVDDLQSSWYLLGLGGAYGLANKVTLLVLILVALVMILTPMSNHSLRMRRTIQSFLIVGLFGALFFPLYSLAYDGVMALVQGMINVALGEQHSSINDASAAMMEVVLPEDVWFKLIVSFLGMILAYCAFAVSLINYLGVMVTAMFYPLAAAVRAISDKFNMLFHGANSAVITTLLTPVIIVVGFLLPEYASQALPTIGATGIAAGIFTIIGALVAFLGPLALAHFAFKGSKRVFGQLDFASFNGSVDVNSMPPVTSRDMDNSVKESGSKAFISSLGAGAVTAQLSKSDDLLGDIKSLTVEAGSAAAAATGHPVVAGGLNAMDSTLSKEKRAHVNESTQLSRETVEAPTGVESNQSSITQRPDKK